jgi:hypothetical protein
MEELKCFEFFYREAKFFVLLGPIKPSKVHRPARVHSFHCAITILSPPQVRYLQKETLCNISIVMQVIRNRTLQGALNNKIS